MASENSILPFTEDDYLSPTGERIVADRYLLKDTQKETLRPGSLVMAVLDAKRAYHELARVVDVDGGTVLVELRDGHRVELAFDRIDVLREISPRQMWQRIATATAQATGDPALWEQKFYALQQGWRYVPGGRVNASMGTGIQTTSYNCFVIPNVGWSVRDYARSFGQTLEIQARSGGVGMNLSQVPPQGTLAPISDRGRKSDLILALDVWHEDLMDFLAQDYANSTKAVRVSKAFLRAVEEGANWTYVFPDTGAPQYDELWNGDLEAWINAELPVLYGTTVPAQVIYERILESGALMLQDLVGLVMNPGDSRGSIADSLGDMWEAMLAQKRVTMLLSSLRPRYSYVRGVNGRSSGAYSWGLLFDKGNLVFGSGFGPVGVAEIMSIGCELTLQGGSRRGALMIILNDRHTDIRKFIRAKQVDGVITGANISVGISEEFMAAKESGENWSLGYPKLADAPEFGGDFAAWEESGRALQTSETIPAATLWDDIIESAWKSAEPGVVFLGRYNKLSNSYYYNPIIATNPCFHPDTRIATEFGLIRIEDLYHLVGSCQFLTVTDNRTMNQVKVVNGRSYAVPGTAMRSATVFPTGVKKTMKVALKNGLELQVTPDHRLLTLNGWKEAKDLTSEDAVYIQSGCGQFARSDDLGKEWGWFLGWLTGDGWLSKHGDIGLVFGRDDIEAIPIMVDIGKEISGVEAKVFERENGTFNVCWWKKELRERLMELGVKPVKAPEKEVPAGIFTAAHETVVAFLQGLFSADGTVYENDENHRTARLSSASKKLLQDVQLLLLNFGIHGEIYRREKHSRFLYETVGGEQKIYESNGYHELVISGDNLAAFKEEIGFGLVSRKQAALDRIARPSRKKEKFYSQVESINDGEVVTVYDIAEPVTHSLIAGGIVAHNCGEQGLPAYGICNLGAVVLSKFAVGFNDRQTRIEFVDKAKEAHIADWLGRYFDKERAEYLLHHVKWEELENVTRTGIRFQDAIIDATYYPFPENRENQMGERRVGLGIMGLHDLFLFLGIRYGSKESVDFIDVLMGMMAEWSYLESVELAKVNGPFPDFVKDKFLQSGYMQMLKKERPYVFEAIAAHGVRNVTTMTIAPTGTTGTMVGCSTGCEPYYAWTYFRNSRLGMFEERASIIDEYHSAFGEGKLPDYFVTSMDLSPEEHVRVQAALQKWIDSSISKTVNAPNQYTVEDTKLLYDLAYDLGCKGITIYRDGSRSEQVLTLKTPETNEAADKRDKDEHEKELAEIKPQANDAMASAQSVYKRRKRPAVLYGATYKKETPLGTAFITINDDPADHLAREVFVNIGKAGTDVYAANEALGRAITLYLKDSLNPEKEAVLVKHFSGIGGHSSVGFGEHRISSVPDAIAKSLIEHYETFPLRNAAAGKTAKGHTADEYAGDTMATDLSVAITNHGSVRTNLRELEVDRDLCPECHQHALVRHGGCYECEACGYSKC